jgi:molybdenum cofactor guanylyltransferase
MIKNISGVVLAGGASSRFKGIIKSKIVIDGRTIIARITETLDELFDEIIIVTNLPEEFKEYSNCKIIGDRIINKGPLGGIHAALKETDREALFVVAGDMPLIDKDYIIRQVDFYMNNVCEVLIPSVNDYIEPLHGIYKKTIIPVLEEYLESEKNYAIRDFFKIADVRYLEFEDCLKSVKAFTNINSPADIIKVKKLLNTNC